MGTTPKKFMPPLAGGCPADAGLGVVSVSHGLRSWDIAHPRLWGTAINENRVPWADSETITPEENLEELIMLGLRLHEGLDLGPHQPRHQRCGYEQHAPDSPNRFG